ncbi:MULTISPECIES: carbohydrate ABC transporter permease [unclassified Microbacterium]|uniref:carbohydrate ABC transporter permease n=1 Tax=unclassified Microbacterium TaxID=2609290 RepID=UPI00214A95A4|nr:MULTISPECIES: carbohydrate ABC transporter permease [unclassified Microbacterium]MCR2811146.1 carbohydrate ABC transporter permease [Microbacterium sp. zg.B185]WIM20740.1 carbohydrate ABC transporter permease [Microbacterium sp. zg-B185]
MTITTSQARPRATARRDASKDVTRLLPRPLLVAATVFLLGIVLIPMAYIVLASMNTDAGVASGEIWPSSFSLESYVKIWTTVDLASALLNSTIVAVSVAIASAFLGVGTAYVLVRYAFTGRFVVLRSLFAFQSIPGTLMVLPVFVVFSSVGMYLGVMVVGTLWGLFIAYLSFALPFSTWIMVTYLRGLPVELEEAARIDGASHLQVLVRIVIPLSWPAIVVAGIFAFLHSWNDVIFASVLTSPETRTVAIALQNFAASQEGGPLPLLSQLMAVSLISAAPVVILYLVFQRYLVGGLTAGAVK